MSESALIKTFDRYSDDAAPAAGAPAARGVWALRITKFDTGAKIGVSSDNLRNIRALTHYRRKPVGGAEPFDVYVSGNIAFEYTTSPGDFDIFDGSLSPSNAIDTGGNVISVGPDADDAVSTGRAVQIAGYDRVAALIRRLEADAAGRLRGIGTSRKVTYRATFRPNVATATAAATTTRVLALQHTTAAAKRVEIRRMRFYFINGNGAGIWTAALLRGSAGGVNGPWQQTTVGGAGNAKPSKHNLSSNANEFTLGDGAMGATFALQAGGTEAFFDGTEFNGAAAQVTLWEPNLEELSDEPLILQAGQAEGFLLTLANAALTSSQLDVVASWVVTEE